jgi:hypothetical protein
MSVLYSACNQSVAAHWGLRGEVWETVMVLSQQGACSARKARSVSTLVRMQRSSFRHGSTTWTDVLFAPLAGGSPQLKAFKPDIPIAVLLRRLRA